MAPAVHTNPHHVPKGHHQLDSTHFSGAYGRPGFLEESIVLKNLIGCQTSKNTAQSSSSGRGPLNTRGLNLKIKLKNESLKKTDKKPVPRSTTHDESSLSGSMSRPPEHHHQDQPMLRQGVRRA